jgi:hypothetical protein
MKKCQTGGKIESLYIKPIVPQTLAINVEDQHEIERFNQDRKRISRPTSGTSASHEGVNKQKSKSKIYEMQSGGNLYTQGYKDTSPFKHLPQITIPSNRITMEGVSQPIRATLDNGQTHIMQPNQNYFFPNTKYVRETKMQTGGQPQGDPTQEMLMSYFQMNQMSEEQIQAFMQEFESMSPEEQQQVLQYIQQELGGQEQPETPSQEMQEAPQEQMMEQQMQAGGMFLREPEYYQSGGFMIPMQTGSYVPPSGYQTIRANPVQMQLSDGSTMKADNVDYTTNPQPKSPIAEKKKELRKAETIYERGQTVRQVQQMLVDAGYDIGKNSKGLPDVDGLLGNKTAAALELYRKTKNLSTTDWKSTFKELSGNTLVAAKVVKDAPVEEKKVEKLTMRVLDMPSDYYTNYKTGYVAGLKKDYESTIVTQPVEKVPLQQPKSVVVESTSTRSTYGQELGNVYTAKPGTIRRGYTATDMQEGQNIYGKNTPTSEPKQIVGNTVGNAFGRKGLFTDPMYYDFKIIAEFPNHYVTRDEKSGKEYKVSKTTKKLIK